MSNRNRDDKSSNIWINTLKYIKVCTKFLLYFVFTLLMKIKISMPICHIFQNYNHRLSNTTWFTWDLSYMFIIHTKSDPVIHGTWDNWLDSLGRYEVASRPPPALSCVRKKERQKQRVRFISQMLHVSTSLRGNYVAWRRPSALFTRPSLPSSFFHLPNGKHTSHLFWLQEKESSPRHENAGAGAIA